MENKMYGRSKRNIREQTERQKRGQDNMDHHDCWENAQPYEFEEEGQVHPVTGTVVHRFHGWECGICRKLLQTG